MKISLLRAGTLAVGLLVGGTACGSDEIRLTSNYDQAETQVVPALFAADNPAKIMTSEAPPACGGCGHCPSCDESDTCSWITGVFRHACDPPVAMPCKKIGGYVFAGFDSFRGISDGSYPNNNGFITGFNLGGMLVEDFDIGWQIGASYGVYNFSGRISPGTQTNEPTQQSFVTLGLFRRADIDHRFSWGLVHDWMISDNFGQFGSSPTLAQFRGQAAWAPNAWNQIGVWATIEDRYVTRANGAAYATSLYTAVYSPVAYQAIDQGNLFWEHQYGAFGATSKFSLGVPLNKRLAQSPTPLFPFGGYGNTLGSFIASTNWNVPISNCLSIYANAMYMKPSAHAGNTLSGFAAMQEFWNVSAGLTFSPGEQLRSKTIAGRTWMPYMPVANNSNFLVDTTKTQ